MGEGSPRNSMLRWMRRLDTSNKESANVSNGDRQEDNDDEDEEG